MPRSELSQFKGFYYELLEDDPPAGWGPELIVPWLQRRPALLEELRQLGRPESHRVRIEPDPYDYNVLEGLYALSRVIDILVAPFQPASVDPSVLSWKSGRPWWEGSLPTAAAWQPFADAIGAVAIAETAFHPFFHEIVSVEPSEDPDAPVTLTAESWPGLLAGGLLLVRSGVTVRAGANELRPAVAEGSCLYWSWWRRNRAVADLSHGWGGGSQWGTDFRRDYIVDGELHYNVDAKTGRAPDEDISADDLRMLLRYRCSLREDLGPDRWPYDQTVVEPA